MRRWLWCISFVLNLCIIGPVFAREVTLFRTILQKDDTKEAAVLAQQTLGGEIVEREGLFYVVEGWYDRFEQALPEEAKLEDWNQVWKYVLCVEMEKAEAEAKGFVIPDLLGENLRRQIDKPSSAEEMNQLASKVNTIYLKMQEKEKDPNCKTEDLIDILEPCAPAMAALTYSENRSDIELGMLGLAKTFYLKGLALSQKRLPATSHLHERFAWKDEELAYESALVEYRAFLDQFPDSAQAEEAAYHIAATCYHLTYAGHHRNKIIQAQQAYQDFISLFPSSDRVPRAKLNLLGISLELARIDGNGFDQVVERGEALLNDYPGAGNYIRGRAGIIVAEAYYEGPKDYKKAIELCNILLDEFRNDESSSIIGSAHRLRAYSNYFLENYENAVVDFSFVIDFYRNPSFHFGYQVDENIAAAYFWRGKSYLNVNMRDLAIADFKMVLERFPENMFAQFARTELTILGES